MSIEDSGKTSPPADDTTQLNSTCHGLGTLAKQYGQFNALAGDHLDADNMQGTRAQISAKNAIEYVLRGVHDADHFHPQAPRIWRTFHERAIAKAIAGSTSADYLQRREAFWEAFYLSAYANHFLEDAFSSGHSGFNRAASTPSESFQFHKQRNQIGRIFHDADGRVWMGYGDSQLGLPKNRGAAARVLAAVTDSVRDVVVTFVTGRAWPQLGRDIDARFPVESRPICFDGAMPDSVDPPVSFGESAVKAWATASKDEDYLLKRGWHRQWLLQQSARLQPSDRAHGAASDQEIAALSQEEIASLNERLATLTKHLDKIEPELSGKPAVWNLNATQCEDWTSLTVVRDPAHFHYTHDVGAMTFGRVAPFTLLLGPIYRFTGSGHGIRLGVETGPYWAAYDSGALGMQLAPTLALPLGGKYGTILSWDLDFKVAAFVPFWSEKSDYDLHLAAIVGAGLTVEFGLGSFRFFTGPGPAMSWRLGPGDDPWSRVALSWQFSISYERYNGTSGGGVMTESPL